MILSAVFEKFLAHSPISVMARTTLEYALAADHLDRLFDATADRQYTRSLLFSTLTELMSLVVCRIRPSVHAAYQADPDAVGVSIRAVSDKLNRIELGVTEAVVAHTAAKLDPVIRPLRGRTPRLVPGYGGGRSSRRSPSWRKRCPGRSRRWGIRGRRCSRSGWRWRRRTSWRR